MRINYLLFLLPYCLICIACQEAPSLENISGVDDIVSDIVATQIESGQVAGLSVGIAKGENVLFQKGYGYADLEFKIPTPSDARYEIGSVTKQFTAAAILQLVEQGKLVLTEDIRSFFPDFDYRGHTITVGQLLDHTSGIISYTEMDVFGAIAKEDLPRDTLVNLVSQAGFDFKPGEAMIYNNSAYFMLGLIIEQVSEMSYEAYVEKHLFEPAGMNDSYYCSESAVVHHRAHGYQPNREGSLDRAAYLNHLWPYAAGSLCSTIKDLIAWNQALHKDRIILGEHAYQQMITPASLNDGTPLRYAKGIISSTIGGKPVIQHGGGIFGFVSDLRYFPEEDLSIVVLINTSGPASPARISMTIAQTLIDFEEQEAQEFEGDKEQITGLYQGRGRGQDLDVEVSINGGVMKLDFAEGYDQELVYIGDGIWEQKKEQVHRLLAQLTPAKEGSNLLLDVGTGLYVLNKVDN
ncbi:MAG: serine hydrolase domain-containing protein [Bacteroidota bacterium]